MNRSINRLFVVVMVALLLTTAAPIFAQEATPTPIPPICTEFIGQPDSERISYYMGEGAGFFAAGELSRAINSFTCITYEIDDAHVPAYLGRAAVLTQRGDFDRAIEDYSRAIQLEPSSLVAYNNRGIVYASIGEYEEALQDFDQALNIDSNSLIALNNRAILYTLLGRYTDAISDLESYINESGIDAVLAELTDPERDEDAPAPQYEPEDARPYALLGIIYSAYSLDNYESYLLLSGPRADFRVQSAAGALESRFTFDLRLDDGSWFLIADFAPEG